MGKLNLFNPKQLVMILLSVLLTLMPVELVRAASISVELSPNMQAVLLSKILLHEKHYRNNESVRVFVLNEPKIAQSFAKLIGNSQEHINIAKVVRGPEVPEEKYDLIYFNQASQLEKVVAYAKRHGIIAVTGNRELVKKGVTLGTGAESGRPHFYLNLSASFATDLEWEQKVLTIVKVYR